MIFAIDPGNEQSAWVLYDEQNKLPIEFAKEPNDVVLERLRQHKESANELAVEMIASYGMSVGQTIFDTCVWVGRYSQLWEELGGQTTKVFRQSVKLHLCGATRAKDSNVRQAIMDRYGSDKKIAIGNKKNPGPLYGVVADIWAALGVAITYCEVDPEEDKKASKHTVDTLKGLLKGK
jgi:hypothetical protein